MHSLNLSTLHQSHLEYLTGCRYAALMRLAVVAKQALFADRRGRPYRHGPLAMVGLVMMKLRHNLTGRALEALAGIDAVTLSRYVRKVTAFLGALPLRAQPAQGFLLVDTTSVRVGSTDRRSFSGHKHQRCAKVQVIADEAGFVQHSGAAWPGSVHDKTIYNKERVNLGEALGTLILADKAYAGAHDEGAGLLRPIKRGERAAKLPAAQAFNAELSRRRVRIEHVFARLKTFRVLQGLFPYRGEQLGTVLRAIALVHNLNRLEAVETR